MKNAAIDWIDYILDELHNEGSTVDPFIIDEHGHAIELRRVQISSNLKRPPNVSKRANMSRRHA
jgi:hypothetical protein